MDRFSFIGGNKFLSFLNKGLKIVERIRPTKHKSHLSFVLHGATLVFIVRVVGYGLTYLNQILFARWIGQAQFGIYAYAFTWVKVLAEFGSMGLDRTALRFIPQYTAQKKWEYAAGMLKYGWRLVLAGSTVLSVIAGIAVLIFRKHIPEHYLLPLLMSFASIPPTAILVMRRDVARAFGLSAFSYLPRMVIFPALLIILSIVMMAMGIRFTAFHVLLASFLILIGVAFFQYFIIKHMTPPDIKNAQPKHEIKVWLRIAFPLLIMTGFMIALTHTGVLMLGAFIEPKEIAVYYAAERISDLVNFVLVSINALGAPKIAFLYTKGKRAELQTFISGIAKWTFWSSFLLSILLVISGKFLLSMFGGNFASGSMILYIMVFGQLVNSAVGPVGYMMVMTGHQDNAAWIFGGTAVLNILLNAALIPFFGAIGAALATSICLMIRNLVAFIAVKRLTGIHTFTFFTPTIKDEQ